MKTVGNQIEPSYHQLEDSSGKEFGTKWEAVNCSNVLGTYNVRHWKTYQHQHASTHEGGAPFCYEILALCLTWTENIFIYRSEKLVVWYMCRQKPKYVDAVVIRSEVS